MSESKLLGPSLKSGEGAVVLASEVEMYKGPSQEAIDASKDALGAVSTKRKRGRPKGAKNKSTLPEPEDMPMHMRFPHPNELRVMLRAQVNGTDSLSLLAMLVDVLDSTLKLTKQKLRKKALRLCR